MNQHKDNKISNIAIKIIIVTISMAFAAFSVAIMCSIINYPHDEFMAWLGVRITVVGLIAAFITDIVKRVNVNDILK